MDVQTMREYADILGKLNLAKSLLKLKTKEINDEIKEIEKSIAQSIDGVNFLDYWNNSEEVRGETNKFYTLGKDAI